jgi:twinkle protein
MNRTFADFGVDVPSNGSGEVKAFCPECKDNRKEKNKFKKPLNVNMEKGTWFCHNCGWTGGLTDRSTDYKERPKVYTLPDSVPKTDLPAAVVKYFADRGINEDVLARNKIGHGRRFMPQANQQMNTIEFPYYRDGKIVNIKYRDGKKNFMMVKGAERLLYGLDDIHSLTIIVEGEIDKLSMEMAGYKNCLSVPDGAPAPDTKSYSSKFDFLADPRLDDVKRFIIAVDSDAPGKRLEDELSRRLGVERCARVVFPDGCKDANETLLTKGSHVLSECVEHALDFPVAGIFEVSDVFDQLDHIYNEGFECGRSTGWSEVDNFYTVRQGEWTLVTGVPSHGKSNFLDAMLVNLAKLHQWRFCICSPENQPVGRHMAGLLEKYSGKSIQTKHPLRMSQDEYVESREWLDEYFSFVMPERPTLKEILRLMRIQVKRRGIRGIVIDPWNEIEHVRNDKSSETEYISLALTELRNFARQNRVHMWIVAHPAKLQKDKDGQYPVPTPYDVAGSAHWRNKADNSITIWRDVGDPTSRVTEVHVQKVRFKEIGKVGMVELAYNHVSSAYSEMCDANKEIPTVYHKGQSNVVPAVF